MSTLEQVVETAASTHGSSWHYDLGVELSVAERLYEVELDRDHWLTYVPDGPGMPVLLAPSVRDLLQKFGSGARVCDVIAAESRETGHSFSQLLRTIDLFYDRWLLREAGQESESDRLIRWRETRPIPKEISFWIHINNNCNLACEYCFVRHTREAMSPDTIDETVSRIGSTARLHGLERITLKFAGGEPTLAMPLVEHFYDATVRELEGTPTQVTPALLTNGTCISKRVLSFVERTKASFNVSLDGYGDFHDVYRIFRHSYNNGTKPRGSWAIIERNIDELIRQGIVPNINATISEKTCESTADLVRWVFGKGMNHCRLSVVRNAESSWEGGEGRLEVYRRVSRKFEESFERAFQVLESPEFILALPEALPIAELSFDEPAPGMACGIGCNHVVVRHDGRVASCPMTVNEEAFDVGDDLFEAVHASFTQSPLDRSDGGVCTSCPWFNVCAGDCPVTNLRIQGHPFAKSPLCEFWKYVIPRYVLFYGRKLLQAERYIGASTPSQSMAT